MSKTKIKPGIGIVTNQAFIWRDFFENKLMGFHDLVEDKTVTIKHLENRKIKVVGGREEVKLLAVFVEKELPLIISKGKSKIMSTLFGSKSPADWAGKKMTLFPDPTAKFAGQEVGGVGIRPILPANPTIPSDRFESLLGAIRSGKYNTAKANSQYKLTDAQFKAAQEAEKEAENAK